MSATISEPFLLSSYGLSKKLPKRGAELNRGSLYVWSTYGKAPKNSDGHATITAQGDGVHVLDVATSHPVVSHTLGPSTSFSCASVSRTTSQDDTLTYAVIDSASDLEAAESGRTIWMWKPDGDSRKKQSTVVSHTVSKLYLPEDLSSRLVLLSPQGDITVLDADLAFKSTLQSENQKQILFRSFIFARKSCSFVPRHKGPSDGAVILSIFATDDKIRVQVIAVGEDDQLVRVSDCHLPTAHEITSSTTSTVTCSESGYLSVLTRSGSWHSFQLDPVDDTIGVSSVAESLQLATLSALTSTHQKFAGEMSLLSLGSSFVLLAGIARTPTCEIALLLWDLQYAVLLASHTLPIPSTLAQADKSGLVLELVGGGSNQTMLVLTPTSPPPSGKNSSKSSDAASSLRSTVLAIPFTVPATSTIAGAMGLASNSSKWLTNNESAEASSKMDAGQMTLLRTMRTAVEQNRPEGASTAFFEWTQKQNQKSQGKANAAQGSQSGVTLGHEFVRTLLGVVLQPSKGADIPYSSKVTRFLLEQRCVCTDMVEGGLLPALKQRNDWPSILLAFDTVLDISENDIVSLLHSVIVPHRRTRVADDAMEVDSPPSQSQSDLIPSLPVFLSSCVSYATSPAPLRLALHQHLSDVEDIIPVLEVLNGWVTEWNAFSLKLVPTMVVKNPKGVTIAKPQRLSKAGTPPLELVLPFLQTLLDASFLNLLQHPPAHAILRRISMDLEPELARVDEMEQLRGPLEPFARAQMKALRESVEGKKDNNQVDWRKKRKTAHQQAEVGIGLYRLEELVL